MTTTSEPYSQREGKANMILAEPDITSVADLSSTDCNKTIEVIVYRKWTSRHNQTRLPTKFCCILLDKQGAAIQANMDVTDTEYFDHLLQLGETYRIFGFSCQKTPTWERTLTNKTSLIFGKYLQVHSIPNDNFPLHYFNFAAYNELADRANVKTAVLTDYIGRIRAVSGVQTFGSATTQRKLRRTIDIENLSGNIIGFALWNEMATGFDMTTYTSLPQPVVIAVSSCWVSRYNGLQLSATSATHYYLNPDIPETYYIKEKHQQSTSTIPFLSINNERYEDLNLERTRNRFPLTTLLQVDPQNYQFVRFTSDITISKINTQKEWYFQKCATCGKKVIPETPIPKCKNHGPQSSALYSYCFKAFVSDESATVSVTCFSEQANSLIKDVHELLAEIPDRDPYHLPAAIRQLEGTSHTFQFHFDTMSTSRRPDFVLDTVFPNIPLALPAPPLAIQIQHPQVPLQAITVPLLEPQPQKTKDITPPDTPLSVSTKEEEKKHNPLTSFAKRRLFTDDPHVDSSDVTKKAKHEDLKADT